MKFVKRDGSEEDFQTSKIIGGLLKAGATPKQAQQVAEVVEKWAQSAAGGKVIALEVWQKVVDEIKRINLAVGKAFEEYRKR